jgi:23S rRNA pseudouridine2605 synthase
MKQKNSPKQSDNVKNTTDNTIRLNKFISNSGVCSRREADTLITAGKIKVNGKTITEVGTKIQSTDTVTYDNKIIKPENFVYILLNKPAGFITTTKDPEERKTVMDLIANATHERVYPVGRLDRNTSGLLLLTNDGELTNTLTHPSSEITKIYAVTLDKPLTKNDFLKIMAGVELEDGVVEIDDLAYTDQNDKKYVGIKIHSGKNRVIRRLFQHLDYEVIKLDRVMFGLLTKKDLPRGKWRFLTDSEVEKLKPKVKVKKQR